MQLHSLPSLEHLAGLYLLDSLKGFGPQKFKDLHVSDISADTVLASPAVLERFGKRGVAIRKQLEEQGQKLKQECLLRAEKQLETARRLRASILTYIHPLYPKTVFESNNPIPVLYVRGNASVLSNVRCVACVGSRGIRQPYSSWHEQFAKTASKDGFSVISGFALGADTIGHRAAVDAGGSTVCVMPSGLDRPFPPENRSLWSDYLENACVVFVSEFPFGMGAVSLNLRKRNKLIVAFAKGVLVSQSSKSGGAMNAYRFALEQKKPVATFDSDQTEDTSGNKLISTEVRAASPVTVFRGVDRDLFEIWLSRLSSLT